MRYLRYVPDLRYICRYLANLQYLGDTYGAACHLWNPRSPEAPATRSRYVCMYIPTYRYTYTSSVRFQIESGAVRENNEELTHGG